MKALASFTLGLAGTVLIVFVSAGVGAAQTGSDTCVGAGATIGSTCEPLTNTTSASNVNTAIGEDALQANTTGSQNTAVGSGALQANTEGGLNTAIGLNSLYSNTTGADNTASGVGALLLNTSGGDNTADGSDALFANTGDNNTAVGTDTLAQNTSGNSNIAIGGGAGNNLTTGDNNIDIGNRGIAAEANTIRIGTQGTQTSTFIAGIFGTPKIKKACEVVVESTGLLGCVKSSARYKRDIRDMGDASDKLMKLRPVTFQYKEDSDGIHQYGLIAEEVEKVYPELVVDGIDGKAETVEYQVLPAMILNEVQKQRRDIERKSAQIAKLRAQIAELKASMRRQGVSFEERLSRIEQTMASRDGGRNIAAAFNRQRNVR